MAAELIAFVRARLAERAALARDAIQPTAKPAPVRGVWVAGPGGYMEADDFELYDDGTFTSQHAAHIAANDPAWVLADVAAKRAIVNAHSGDQEGDPAHECPQPERPGPGNYTAYEVGCHTLRLLALPDASHPDYQPEWKP